MAKKTGHFKRILSFILAMAIIITSGSFSLLTAEGAGRPRLNKTRLNLYVKGKARLKVKVSGKVKIKKKVFRSSKKKVASVSRSGKVTAKKKGAATITCKVILKNKKKYTLKCKVKVMERAQEDDTQGTEVSASPLAPPVSPAVSANPQATGGTVTPTGSPAAAHTPEPVITGVPAETGNPNPSGTQGPTPAETGNPNPSETQKPAPIETESPKPTEISGTTPEPGQTKTPDDTEAPAVTPEQTKNPTDIPTDTPETNPSGTPAVSDKPVVTNTPVPGIVHPSKNGIDTIDDGVMHEEKTSFDIVHEMGIGINLGNTLESCGTWINASSVSSYETAWGAPITTQEMISGMKEAGFRSIRIPVAWSNMMSKDGNYTINDAYFDRVETVMNYALNEGMYVIINIHYDGGWWGMFGSPDASVREQGMQKYRRMWEQIADRFEEYSDKVIFESANEELGERLNEQINSSYVSDENGTKGTLTVDECYQVTNEINQTFVTLIRNSGGNNAKRFLLLAGYDTSIEKTCNRLYQMPTDTIENHMMVSVHYYSPATYCIADKKDNSWGYRDSWGTSADIATAKSELQDMKLHFVDKGIPVVIGEYGVCNTEEGTRKEGRDLFFKTVVDYSLDNGMCPVLWDTADHIYSRKTCTIINENEAANYLEAARKAEENPVYEPPQGDVPYRWSGTIGTDENWNVTAAIPEDGNTFSLNQTEAYYTISNVDWSKFANPVLVITTSASSGSAGYKMNTELTEVNQHWHYVDNNSPIKGDWNTSGEQKIDLSALNLTGEQSLYFQCTGQNVSLKAVFEVREK